MKAFALVLLFASAALISWPGPAAAQIKSSLAAPAREAAQPASLANIAEASAADAPLMRAITDAGLLPTLSGKGPFTFFAPSAQALSTWTETNPKTRHQQLLNHVVAGRYVLSDLSDGALLTTLGGQTLTVLRKKDKILVNGVAIMGGDVPASNGISHTVNGLLTP